MFRCDHCENYRDKSEACENPNDPCSCICQDCESELGSGDDLYKGINWEKELEELQATITMMKTKVQRKKICQV